VIAIAGWQKRSVAEDFSGHFWPCGRGCAGWFEEKVSLEGNSGNNSCELMFFQRERAPLT
jgi:hypothetical protein